MTSREDFSETWLVERPQRVVTGNLFSLIKQNIEDYLLYGAIAVDLSAGYKKIIREKVAFYWHETNSEIDIGCELTIRPQALVVNILGKKYDSTTYASDLYQIILSDNDKSILMSDEKLSDSGFSLWKRLIGLGHTISLYDRSHPGTLISLRTPEELNDFFSQDKDFQRYQYVLSESNTGMKLADTRSYFNTRRMRELSGLL